jgi:hypothetical protein
MAVPIDVSVPNTTPHVSAGVLSAQQMGRYESANQAQDISDVVEPKRTNTYQEMVAGFQLY